jgi:hypothetical protein
MNTDMNNLTLFKLPKALENLMDRVKRLERQKDPDRWIKRTDAMKILGIGSTKLWQLEKQGILENLNPTGHPKFSHRQVMSLVSKGL